MAQQGRSIHYQCLFYSAIDCGTFHRAVLELGHVPSPGPLMKTVPVLGHIPYPKPYPKTRRSFKAVLGLVHVPGSDTFKKQS